MFEALKTFQSDHGLQPDGRITPDGEVFKLLSAQTSDDQLDGQYRWMSVADDRVRASHAARHGEILILAPTPTRARSIIAAAGPFPSHPKSQKTLKKNCDEERAYEAAKQRVKELSERLNDLLLKIYSLREKHRSLIEDASVTLGAQIVAYLLTAPIERAGLLVDMLQRYFGGTISDKLLRQADLFVRQAAAVTKKMKNGINQYKVVRSMLDKAAQELENALERLEACRNAQGDK